LLRLARKKNGCCNYTAAVQVITALRFYNR